LTEAFAGQKLTLPGAAIYPQASRAQKENHR
jgi:hypothetical protein